MISSALDKVEHDWQRDGNARDGKFAGEPIHWRDESPWYSQLIEPAGMRRQHHSQVKSLLSAVPSLAMDTSLPIVKIKTLERRSDEPSNLWFRSDTRRQP